MEETPEDPHLTEIAEAELDAALPFEDGDEVWVHDENGGRHPGIFVGLKQRSAMGVSAASAIVVDPERQRTRVIPMFRLTRRD